jgi:UDP-N-acetylglucosamine 2-epimerase (non-hydrolysing)
MKMAPIFAALRRIEPPVRLTLVHTGQHYDTAMNEQYFDALGLPLPDVNLEVGSASHAVQTAEVMRRFEPVLDRDPASAVLVVGDVNSTLACALVAAKKNIPVIHVEAGLRSFDRAMPEEINRIVTDQLSELLFISEPCGWENLLREGVAEHRLHMAGNVMIDSLHQQLDQATPVAEIVARSAQPGFLRGGGGDSEIGTDTQAQAARYALLTLHRPSNVDHRDHLQNLLGTVAELSAALPVIFPVHPRTLAMLDKFGLHTALAGKRVLLLPPAGSLDMLGLMRQATVVLTDSGGVQEETTALGVPCITLRTNTERPVTVTEGTNTLAGDDRKLILALCVAILRGEGKAGRVPRLWDGQAATRIAAVIADWLRQPAAAVPG